MINDDVTDVSTGVLVIGETTGVVVITAITSAIMEMILSSGDLAYPLSYPFSAVISQRVEAQEMYCSADARRTSGDLRM